MPPPQRWLFTPQPILPQAARSWTHPELGEVGIGGVVGLVVGVQQDGNDLLLLLRQLGPQTVPQGFLLLPLQDHLSLPLHLLIRQDDCGARAGRGRLSGGLGLQLLGETLLQLLKAQDRRGARGWGASRHGGLGAYSMDGKLGFLLKWQMCEIGGKRILGVGMLGIISESVFSEQVIGLWAN